jgi:hypothetical protein
LPTLLYHPKLSIPQISSIQGWLERSFDSENGMRPVSSHGFEMPVVTAFAHSPVSLVIIKKMDLWFDIIGEEYACLRGGDYRAE